MRRYFYICFFLLAAIGLTASLAPSSVLAADLAEPTGPVILTVTGNIKNTNANGRAEFDRAMLEALGLESFHTETPWTKGLMTFEGVPAKSILAAVGAYGSQAKVTALDDYSVVVPTSDFLEFPVMLAMKMNGEIMSMRSKGPLWLLYDFSANEHFSDPSFRDRMVWQIRTIQVK